MAWRNPGVMMMAGGGGMSFERPNHLLAPRGASDCEISILYTNTVIARNIAAHEVEGFRAALKCGNRAGYISGGSGGARRARRPLLRNRRLINRRADTARRRSSYGL